MRDMRRREFIALIAGAATAWPLAAHAQQSEKVRRIGALMPWAESDAEAQARIAAFHEALYKLGWREDRNLRIEYRWAGDDADRLRRYAAELVAMTPDVILAGPQAAMSALHRETRTIPIVFAQVGDPVGQGFVASLARPGGNSTGFVSLEYAMGVKWLELLKQIAPRVARVAVVYDPTNLSWVGYLREIEAAASSLGVQVSASPVSDAGAIEHAIRAFAAEPHGGLILLPGPVVVAHRDLIIAVAAKHRLPAVYSFRFYVANGGLASYSVDVRELYRRAAGYVDRILKGEKSAELPVQLPTKYELTINLKTAEALGLDVPVSLLARTDEVIE
jgi:putative tryptophan/tyrosine transport system substrate-binding protein